MNLIDEMHKATGNWPIEKIDPNTQAPTGEASYDKDLLPQAVIPVALLGLYHYTRSEEHAQTLVGGNASEITDWKNRLYGTYANEVTSNIASYAHTSLEKTESALNYAAST